MSSWPRELPRNIVCFSVDVEWAAPAVLDDTTALFDSFGIAATFFVTHPGVVVSGHERALHPNFRRDGDTYRALSNAGQRSDAEINKHVIATTHGFAPEAKGVRAHSLHFDSTLLPLYIQHGIEYDSSVRLPLMEGLRPCLLQHDIIEIPTYYADYFDLVAQATSFNVRSIDLESDGVKVFDFHPNLVYINAPDEPSYFATKNFYRDAERLRAHRYRGRGTRTFLVELLETVKSQSIPTATLGTINQVWRNHKNS